MRQTTRNHAILRKPHRFRVSICHGRDRRLLRAPKVLVADVAVVAFWQGRHASVVAQDLTEPTDSLALAESWKSASALSRLLPLLLRRQDEVILLLFLKDPVSAFTVSFLGYAWRADQALSHGLRCFLWWLAIALTIILLLRAVRRQLQFEFGVSVARLKALGVALLARPRVGQE